MEPSDLFSFGHHNVKINHVLFSFSFFFLPFFTAHKPNCLKPGEKAKLRAQLC